MKPNDLPDPAAEHGVRQHWLSELAMAPLELLELFFEKMEASGRLPVATWLRKPQSGLTMVRARAGGTGMQFNLGEASVTRCAMQDGMGRVGIGYVRGGNSRHAELVALFDLALQDAALQSEILDSVVSPLAAARVAAREKSSCEAAATRVAFYAMAREQQ
ncbi:MAG: phosphonate C-P lyase system protein PhnG [Sulfuritalea sp.]|nr:phosphonate C-P lyase system protein PhnG [Sulfuritalea sp.]